MPTTTPGNVARDPYRHGKVDLRSPQMLAHGELRACLDDPSTGRLPLYVPSAILTPSADQGSGRAAGRRLHRLLASHRAISEAGLAATRPTSSESSCQRVVSDQPDSPRSAAGVESLVSFCTAMPTGTRRLGHKHTKSRVLGTERLAPVASQARHGVAWQYPLLDLQLKRLVHSEVHLGHPCAGFPVRKGPASDGFGIHGLGAEPVQTLVERSVKFRGRNADGLISGGTRLGVADTDLHTDRRCDACATCSEAP
jgi:hypothetical protein